MRGRVVAVAAGAALVVAAAVVGVGLLTTAGGSDEPAGDPDATTVSLRVRSPWRPAGAPAGACADGAAVAADPVDVPAEGLGFAARMTAPTTMTYAPQSGCTANGILDPLRPGTWTVSVGPTVCDLSLQAGAYAVDLKTCTVTAA